MRRVKLSPAVAIMLVLVCAACSKAGDLMDSFTFTQSREAPVEPNIFPADFKAQIIRTVPKIQDDPSNLRGAFYSDPVLDPKGSVQVYTSCVRFDARDITQQYLGSRDYVAYYYGGRLQQFVPAAQGQCNYATYKPFPELEQACQKPRCTNG
jgi:hypothetical protein